MACLFSHPFIFKLPESLYLKVHSGCWVVKSVKLPTSIQFRLSAVSHIRHSAVSREPASRGSCLPLSLLLPPLKNKYLKIKMKVKLCKQYIIGLIFYYIFTGVYRTLIFKIIIDTAGLIYTSCETVFYFLHKFFVYFSFPPFLPSVVFIEHLHFILSLFLAYQLHFF